MMRRTIGRSKLASHGQVLVVEGHENRAVFIQVESNQAVSMEEDKHTLGSENGSWDQQDFKTWGDRCNKHWMSSNKSKGLRSQWSMGLLYIPIFSVYIWRYIHYINYTSTKYLLYIVYSGGTEQPLEGPVEDQLQNAIFGPWGLKVMSGIPPLCLGFSWDLK